MAKRINISLPDEAIRVMDQVTRPGQRSRFIADAIHHYVTTTGKAVLRARLKEGAAKHAERDLEMATEWFSLEQEAWPDARARTRRG